MQPDLVTKLIFNRSVTLEISSDYVDSVLFTVSNDRDTELQKRAFHIEPDEIELFISILNVYKNRVLGGRKNEE